VRAAILVPAPDYPEDWDWAYEVEAAVLLRAGLSVEARQWNDPGDLACFDLVMPLVAWGYHQDPPRWHALLDRLEREGLPIRNPVPLLRWNSDKRYLTELEAKGVATIPTRICEALDEAGLARARHDFGEELVIKPPVSASAYGTHRLGPNDGLPEEARGRPMMVQPFLRSVAEEGEYSIMLFGGRFSHAIVKRPKAGDYRVQPHLGGTEMPCAAPEGAIDLAHAALAAAPAEATYARVDMVRDNQGELAIIELELIEPALWLQHAPDGGEGFASAIRAALPHK
jgi:glutathione synthase/RimK-type ligase-like ATP-grasp enzyme